MKSPAPTQFHLTVYQHGEVLTSVKIEKFGTYSVGRSKQCNIAIEDESLSRTHLEIEFSNAQLAVIDRSSNGSSIRNQLIGKDNIIEIVGRTRVDLSNQGVAIDIDPIGSESASPVARGYSGSRIPEKAESHAEQASDVLDRLKQKKQLLIGRAANCDIVLPTLQVSRQHAMLRWQDGQITIEDLNSTNGTFVNGEQVSGQRTVKLEDQLHFGTQLFVLSGDAERPKAIIARNIVKTFGGGAVGLNSMSLAIASREFVALMGPSGCGKSTLLKCLNGAGPATAGEIIIQGLPLNNANFNILKKHIGYVPQEDIIHPDLNVERTLYYAAKLRMANDVTDEEIDQKITDVLSSLNLDAKLRKTKVKDLSGGQRKRISIAVELLNDPTILFLDEPTSPLDPETIEDFLSCIRNLANKGQTVIMVTHKPSDLDYVDKVLFLSKGGYQVYYGSRHDLLRYFDRNNIVEIYALLKDAQAGKTWNQKWLQNHPGEHATSHKEMLQPRPDTSLIRQFYWLTRRYLDIKLNDVGNMVLLLGQPVAIAGLLAFIFTDLQITVLFMMAIAAIWFGISNASKEIIAELPIYERERMFNLSIPNYIASKVIVLSLIALAQVLIFIGIASITFSHNDKAVQLWDLPGLISFLFYLSISSTLFGLLLSAAFNNAEKVMTFVPIAVMPQFMLAGVFAPMNSDFKMVLSYLTLGRLGTNGLAHVQDAAAKAHEHWAGAGQQLPAGVMNWLPKIIPAADAATGATTATTAILELQPQSAIQLLNMHDTKLDVMSIFPEGVAGAYAALTVFNILVTIAVVIALKRKDSRFV